ncbi:MBL fold metallo-hydrolase [Planctomycetota bacterium]|nr:MBL fold metallo-hydrolase [Planctomycetota bacterium]
MSNTNTTKSTNNNPSPSNSITRRTALTTMTATLATTPLLINTAKSFAQSTIPATPLSPSKPVDTLQGAGFYRFNLGTMQCAIISDGQNMMPPSTFAQNIPKTQIDQVLHENFLNNNEVPTQINTMLCCDEGINILIDTGLGLDSGPGNGLTVPHLERMGLKPEDIGIVVITHMHGDHIGGLFDHNGQKTFSNAELVISQQAFDYWSKAKPGTGDARMQGLITGAQEVLEKYKDNLRTVVGDDEVVQGMKVVPLFGHTPGHIGLQIARGNDQLFYIADTVHMVYMQMPHPDWQVAFDMNKEQAVMTRKRVFALAAEERLLVAGSHIPFPALGHVRKQAPAYMWQPIIWIWNPTVE